VQVNGRTAAVDGDDGSWRESMADMDRIMQLGPGHVVGRDDSRRDLGPRDCPRGAHRALAGATDEAAAEAECIAFLKKYIKPGIAPMCGNTIGQDRRFMAKYMPKLEAFFHYRNIDVSTLKELCKRWHPELVKGFTKKQAHTALADIEESIEELKYYREKFIAPLPE
jgi:hypothetical protein